MTPAIKNAEYLDGYRIKVAFEDGAEAEIDLEPELWGEVFEPLKDLKQFRSFRIHPELRTLVWPNGADLAPEFLYSHTSA